MLETELRERHVSAAPPKQFDALYVPGRSTYSQQFRLLSHRVHNTTVFGARLSMILATVVLLGLVMTLTMEADPAESSAYEVRQVRPSEPLRNQLTQTNEVLTQTTGGHQNQAQQAHGASQAQQAHASPLTGPPTVAAQQWLQPPAESLILRHELPNTAFHTRAIDPQLLPPAVTADKNFVVGGEGVPHFHGVSKPPGLPLPALDSPFVRPRDAPDDIPDWALKPAFDLPFFADEPVNDRPTGTGTGVPCRALPRVRCAAAANATCCDVPRHGQNRLTGFGTGVP